ncbi:MAG: UvrD/REP helicase [Nocardioidaceae bacterium]|nr:UvrD/REP helicase [Nocardioidaceae bacterium]
MNQVSVRYVLQPRAVADTPGPGGAQARVPVLDEDQQAVVDHDGGPQLVLAGPGTGKTTTLVESVVDRVERRGLRADQVLVLTFSRKAADELRTRITTRLGRTTSGAVAMTFHAFCYALVRRFSLTQSAQHPDPVDEPEEGPGGQLVLPLGADPEPLWWRPPTLVSAPEQDVRIRELLLGSAPTPSVTGDVSTAIDWPRGLYPALRTRGMARELQAVLARARALGLDPDQLAAIGRRDGQPAWVAAADFFATYLDVFDAQGLLDYGELVHRALLIARDPAQQQQLRSEFRYVVVDEFQDTDPAQVALLQALAGDGHDLLVVGDPDQSIYAFRGADVSGILRFPSDFRRRDGRPAEVRALQSTRRFGPAILAAARSVSGRLPVPALADPDEFARFRAPRSVEPAYGDGRVEVRLFASASAEAEQVADLLRRAHVEDHVPWAEMAVLVRSGRASIPRLRRALTTAGVPVEVAGDEVPLRSEPAVQVLLQALRVIGRLHRAAPGSTTDNDGFFGGAGPTLVRPDEAEALLVSPLGGLDPGAVRRLARRLRRHDRDEHADARLPRPSARLLAEALADPSMLLAVGGPEAERAGRLARLLADGARLLDAGGSAESVLWHVWEGSRWPERLREAACPPVASVLSAVSAPTARSAAVRAGHRDLDAVVALFDLAARVEERQRGLGLQAFLDEIDEQQIPADTLAEQGVRGDGVRLLTAHRAKGLQWRLVVVAGVQDGSWPDLRRRGTLLHADRIDREESPPDPGPGPGRGRPGVTALLADERRLFYVAVTRARERVVVTAVASPSEGGDQPSRFVHELGVAVPAVPEGRPRRPLSLPGLLGELRAMAEATDDAGVRREIALRISRLAVAGDAGVGARPDAWWGVRDVTRADTPVRPADQPLALSASAVDSVVGCPLRWFLTREAGGMRASTVAQGFGSLVHGLAEAVVRGEVTPDVDAMVAHLDRVWDQLDFAVPWASAAERLEAERAVARFVAWHTAERGREVLAAEHEFRVTLGVGDDEVTLRGSMDRLERDEQGRVVVVDFKTGKHPPREMDVPAHPQLGVYQIAVRSGAATELLGDEAPDGDAAVGGAELVHLRSETRGRVKVQHQPPPADSAAWAGDEQLAGVVRTIRAESFPATPGLSCTYCDVRTSCPAQPEGASIVSSAGPLDQDPAAPVEPGPSGARVS